MNGKKHPSVKRNWIRCPFGCGMIIPIKRLHTHARDCKEPRAGKAWTPRAIQKQGYNRDQRTPESQITVWSPFVNRDNHRGRR